MKRFQKILVGVDLCSETGAICRELSPSTQSAIDKGLWLGEHTGAHVTFMASLMPCLGLDADARHLAEMLRYQSMLDAMYERAHERMADLVEHARQKGVDASNVQVTGTPWVELVREAVRGEHDLVLVGSHRQHSLGRVLLGNTGRRLVRKCPCPVWVTSPVEAGAVRKILAPTDFSPTANEAVRLAHQLALKCEAELHVLHAVEYHFEPQMRDLIIPVDEIEEYRSRIRGDSEQQLNDCLEELGIDTSTDAAHRHVAAGPPHLMIRDAVKNLEIDLVAMGTQARSGITGVLLGNTAERVLSHLTCSVLAVKPEGFVCPVQFPEDEEE